MKQVGVYDAKTHLARLLDEVERGETVTITRHGRPVAKLVPVSPNRRSVQEAIEELREFRASPPAWRISRSRTLSRKGAGTSAVRRRCIGHACVVFSDDEQSDTPRESDAAPDDPAIVPSLWPLEIANGLLVAERRGRMTRSRNPASAQTLTALPIRADGYRRSTLRSGRSLPWRAPRSHAPTMHRTWSWPCARASLWRLWTNPFARPPDKRALS